MITQKIIVRTDSLKLDKIISRYGEDSMRQVVFIVVRPEPDSEELIPITIPEDAVGSFRILKPSGNFVIVPMNKSVLASGETAFDVVLPASANTAKGSGYYDIRITSDTDKYYFTAQGDFLIDDNIISDEVLEDVSEVNGLIFPDDFLTVEDNVAYIDDDTISTDRTWSSNKINEEIEAHAGGDVSKIVSGNPITFTDGASAPLVKCVTEIQGYQEGSGTPSPDNVRPIVAYTEGEIVERGKNLISEIEQNTYNSDGTTYVSAKRCRTPIFKLRSGSDYVFSFSTSDTSKNIRVVYQTWTNDSYTNNQIIDESQNKTSPFTITPQNDIWISLNFKYTDDSNITPSEITAQGEKGTTPTDYEPYVGTTHTTTYPSAIYRGSEDVVEGEVSGDKIVYTVSDETGVQNITALTNTSRVLIDMNTPQLKSGGTHISNYLDYIENYTLDTPHFYMDYNHNRIVAFFPGAMTSGQWRTYIASNPLQVAYELATPTTTSVTPTNLPVKSLSGYTHIESTTGDMEVEYITQRFQPLIDSIKQL